jgi:hypothetical protein
MKTYRIFTTDKQEFEIKADKYEFSSSGTIVWFSAGGEPIASVMSAQLVAVAQKENVQWPE